MSIQRWHLEAVTLIQKRARMVRIDRGEWVRYDDHAAEVARLQARERELEADPRLAVSSEDMWRVAANAVRVRELETALRELARYADDAIGTAYGTLRASMVRDIALAALGAETEGEA